MLRFRHRTTEIDARLHLTFPDDLVAYYTTAARRFGISPEHLMMLILWRAMDAAAQDGVRAEITDLVRSALT